MIYLTGDIHGNPTQVELFCSKMQLTEKDTIIMLGDVGLNYYGGKRDRLPKRILSSLPVTFLCIHGNHENRPQNIPTSYSLKTAKYMTLTERRLSPSAVHTAWTSSTAFRGALDGGQMNNRAN